MAVRLRVSPSFSKQSTHRWRWGCQPQAPAALYPAGRFLVLISVRGWVDPRVVVRLEGLGQLKNPMISSGFEPATFCSIVPQPTKLPRASTTLGWETKFYTHKKQEVKYDFVNLNIQITCQLAMQEFPYIFNLAASSLHRWHFLNSE
jgi:hypothetical protein